MDLGPAGYAVKDLEDAWAPRLGDVGGMGGVKGRDGVAGGDRGGEEWNGKEGRGGGGRGSWVLCCLKGGLLCCLFMALGITYAGYKAYGHISVLGSIVPATDGGIDSDFGARVVGWMKDGRLTGLLREVRGSEGWSEATAISLCRLST